jgi:diguanylate cyclase (GGDEF)-like protein
LPLLYRIFELHQKNLQLSRYDGLTGLMTRSYFDYVFEDRLAVSQRHQYELLVVVFDLDGLKKINDYYGHLAGDHYITTFAALLKQSYRKSDMFSRVGGDEFVGLFSSTTAEALDGKICSMRTEFEKIEIQAELGHFNGSFSFGIAQFPNDSDDKSKLMQIADANMYKDKMRKK